MVIITGASKGIGKYLFDKFIEAGEIVYGTYNSTYPKTEHEEYYTKVDISNYSDVINWMLETVT